VDQQSYELRLNILDLMSLEKRQIGDALIETYKILTGKENINPRQLFDIVHTGPLRNCIPNNHGYQSTRHTVNSSYVLSHSQLVTK